ncbi:MAG: hypothetical protein ACOC4M_04560 [Promethearchaeia archaeon]
MILECMKCGLKQKVVNLIAGRHCINCNGTYFHIVVFIPPLAQRLGDFEAFVNRYNRIMSSI